MQQLFIDANRCIGCRACVEACSECPGHGGFSMIHLDDVERSSSVQTSPTVCMHCAEPACASVCPADAIKVDPDGVVLSAAPERCIGCGNCELACPFGVPKIDARRELMMKCDLCYDRTSVGLKPMCATVCPSGALFYGTQDEVEDRRRARPLDVFAFGEQLVATRNALMVPSATARVEVRFDAGPVRSPAERHMEEALCDSKNDPLETFPIALDDERRLDRRRFLCAAGSAAALALGGEWAARGHAQDAEPVLVVAQQDAADLAPGESRAVRDAAGREALVVRLDDGEVVAFDRRCPHLGCPVLWSAERARFECPCHHAAFAARTGEVLFGPPRRGLPPAVVRSA